MNKSNDKKSLNIAEIFAFGIGSNFIGLMVYILLAYILDLIFHHPGEDIFGPSWIWSGLLSLIVLYPLIAIFLIPIILKILATCLLGGIASGYIGALFGKNIWLSVTANGIIGPIIYLILLPRPRMSYWYSTNVIRLYLPITIFTFVMISISQYTQENILKMQSVDTDNI